MNTKTMEILIIIEYKKIGKIKGVKNDKRKKKEK